MAAELERSAGRAQAPGGAAAAAAFLDRAVTPTPDPARRRERAVAAAQAGIAAWGSFTESSRPARHGGRRGARRAQPRRESTCSAPSSRSSPAAEATDATPLLLAAARRLEPLDASLARETYVDRAFSAALFGARLNRSVRMPEVAEAARAAPGPSDGEPATADLLLDALVALADDYATAVPRCRKAVRRLGGEKASARSDCVRSGRVASSPSRSGRRTCARAVALQRRDRPRDGDAERAGARPQRAHAGAGVLRSLAAAAATVSETESVEEVTGIRAARTRVGPLGVARHAAGDDRPDRDDRARGRGCGEGIGLAISADARAVLCNGLGLYEEAGGRRRHRLSECKRSSLRTRGLSELVESADALRKDRSRDGRPGATGRRGAGHADRMGARHRGARSSPSRPGRRRGGAGFGRESSISARLACVPSSPARIFSMANDCGARIAGSTRAPS